MSDIFLSFLIAVGILVAMFVCVPMLHVCNSGCQRFFGRKGAAERMDSDAGRKGSGALAERA